MKTAEQSTENLHGVWSKGTGGHRVLPLLYCRIPAKGEQGLRKGFAKAQGELLEPS